MPPVPRYEKPTEVEASNYTLIEVSSSIDGMLTLEFFERLHSRFATL